ncbi:MAG: hypothetical protein ABH871_09790 [Pseudomonadota bacterium]
MIWSIGIIALLGVWGLHCKKNSGVQDVSATSFNKLGKQTGVRVSDDGDGVINSGDRFVYANCASEKYGHGIYIPYSHGRVQSMIHAIRRPEKNRTAMLASVAEAFGVEIREGEGSNCKCDSFEVSFTDGEGKIKTEKFTSPPFERFTERGLAIAIAKRCNRPLPEKYRARVDIEPEAEKLLRENGYGIEGDSQTIKAPNGKKFRMPVGRIADQLSLPGNPPRWTSHHVRIARSSSEKTKGDVVKFAFENDDGGYYELQLHLQSAAVIE